MVPAIVFPSVDCDNYALIEGFKDKTKSSLTFIRINKRGIKIIIVLVLLYGKKKKIENFLSESNLWLLGRLF